MPRTEWMTYLATGVLAVALGIGESSCTNVDCGTGTMNKDGACVPADNTVGNASCDVGTTLDQGTGKCESTTSCGDNTMAVEDPTTHAITCVGTGGGGGDCSKPISCPTPSGGKMTICGQLLDIENDQPIKATGTPMGAACDAANPSADGPCAMRVLAYDAIAFAGGPDSASPLPTDEIVIDDCGRYRIKNISPQGASFIGIGIDDNPKATATHRRVGVAVPTAAGKALASMQGYALRITTDQTWTNGAGLSGMTFADRGVYMALFRHGVTPVAGVKITRNASTNSAGDYYFTDTAANSRATVDSGGQDVTGANGAGLMLGSTSQLIQYSGTGGEPTGGGGETCKWPSDLGDQIPGVAFIQPRVAVLSSMTTTACP